MTRKIAAGLGALSLLLLPACSDATQPEARAAEQMLTPQQQLDSWLAEQPLFSGLVLIARDGQILARRDVGWADREAERPVTPNTVFSIASVGKLITALAVQQLAESGELDLSDPVTEWLPEFGDTLSPAITLDHLLNHTSGLPRLDGIDDATLDGLRSNADLIALLGSNQVRSNGPADFAYRNINYILLGEVIARASGEAYETYIARHISERAGMNGPLFIREDRSQGHAVARAYLPVDYETWWNSEDEVIGASVDDYHFTTPQITPLAGGGSYASGEDMLALATALRNASLVSQTSLSVACGLDERDDGASGYGRGCSWRVGPYGHRLGHTGSTAGVQARFFLYWEAGVDVIILSNHEVQAAPLFSEIDAALRSGWLTRPAP